MAAMLLEFKNGHHQQSMKNTRFYGYVGRKATDGKAAGSLYIGCFFVGTKVANLSAQKATMKIYFFAMQQSGYASLDWV